MELTAVQSMHTARNETKKAPSKGPALESEEEKYSEMEAEISKKRENQKNEENTGAKKSKEELREEIEQIRRENKRLTLQNIVRPFSL